MKLKNKLKLDLIKRNNYNKFEHHNNLIKLVTNNSIINKNKQNNLGVLLNNYFNYQTKTKNTCMYTGRMRGNITSYKMNRTKFKLLINQAAINGIKLSSW